MYAFLAAFGMRRSLESVMRPMKKMQDDLQELQVCNNAEVAKKQDEMDLLAADIADCDAETAQAAIAMKNLYTLMNVDSDAKS
jgi:hypothetical protein